MVRHQSCVERFGATGPAGYRSDCRYLGPIQQCSQRSAQYPICDEGILLGNESSLRSRLPREAGLEVGHFWEWRDGLRAVSAWQFTSRIDGLRSVPWNV